MSDLVENPEDRFSHVAAQIKVHLQRHSDSGDKTSEKQSDTGKAVSACEIAFGKDFDVGL